MHSASGSVDRVDSSCFKSSPNPTKWQKQGRCFFIYTCRVLLFTYAEYYCLHIQSFIVFTCRVLLFAHAEFYCLHIRGFIVYTYRVLLFTHAEFHCLHMKSFIIYTCRVLLFIQNSWLQRSAQGWWNFLYLLSINYIKIIFIESVTYVWPGLSVGRVVD